MALTLGMITLDTHEPRELARWWAEQTEAEIRHNDDDVFIVIAGGGLPVMLGFQKVGEPTPGKNRLHLDLSADDLDTEVDRLVAAGATLVARRGDESFPWVTLTDPHGNEFDVARQG